MKFQIDELSPKTEVVITGDEPWLGRIYGDFPATVGPKPRLTGRVVLEKNAGGTIQVSGRVAFAPEVPCSRCVRQIPWPMQVEISTRFLPEDGNPAPRERNLSEAELDVYYLEGSELDLELVINDAVQTELPSRILAVADDGSSCKICHESLEGDRIYGEEGPEDKLESPFAALKDLKLKH